MNSFVLLCQQLDDMGFLQASKKLHFLLHECSWTSSSELYGELGQEMKAIKAKHWKSFTPEAKRVFELSAQSVRNVWPEFKL